MKLNKLCALRNVTIISAHLEEPQEGKTILIKNGWIEKIMSASAPYSSEYQTVDLTGSFVMPGMIDAHTHLCGCINDLVAETFEDPIMQALRSIPQAQTLLRYGFTGVRDVSWNSHYLKRLFAEGDIRLPRVVSAGPGLAHPCINIEGRKHGTPGFRRLPNEYIAQGSDEICRAVADLFSRGADHIKMFANGSTICATDRTQDQYFTQEEMKLVVAQTRKVKGAKVLAHILQNHTAKDCLAADVDVFEHCGYMDEELAQGMRERGKYHVPTIFMLSYCDEVEISALPTVKPFEAFYARDMLETEAPKAQRTIEPKVLNSFKLAHEMGVNIGLGSDSVSSAQTPYGESSLQEFKMLCDYGMTPMEAIRSATKINSEILGLEKYLGTVEENKVADLLILNRNPVEDVDVISSGAHLEYVIQNGQVVVDRGQITEVEG